MFFFFFFFSLGQLISHITKIVRTAIGNTPRDFLLSQLVFSFASRALRQRKALKTRLDRRGASRGRVCAAGPVQRRAAARRAWHPPPAGAGRRWRRGGEGGAHAPRTGGPHRSRRRRGLRYSQVAEFRFGFPLEPLQKGCAQEKRHTKLVHSGATMSKRAGPCVKMRICTLQDWQTSLEPLPQPVSARRILSDLHRVI